MMSGISSDFSLEAFMVCRSAVQRPVGDPGFPRGRQPLRGPQPTFSGKLYENEEILAQGRVPYVP